jgi:hypothetical protein
MPVARVIFRRSDEVVILPAGGRARRKSCAPTRA